MSRQNLKKEAEGLIKEAFIQGKYLEPVAGGVLGAGAVALSPGIETNKSSVGIGALSGAAGVSALGRLSSKIQADKLRKTNYLDYFTADALGKKRDYIKPAENTSLQVIYTRRAALNDISRRAANKEHVYDLDEIRDLRATVAPIYKKEMDPRIKKIKDTFFGLDLQDKYSRNLNSKKLELDSYLRLNDFFDDAGKAGAS